MTEYVFTYFSPDSCGCFSVVSSYTRAFTLLFFTFLRLHYYASLPLFARRVCFRTENSRLYDDLLWFPTDFHFPGYVVVSEIVFQFSNYVNLLIMGTLWPDDFPTAVTDIDTWHKMRRSQVHSDEWGGGRLAQLCWKSRYWTNSYYQPAKL